MELNGHGSSLKLGTSTAAVLNYHCKIMMNQKDDLGVSSTPLHVSGLIGTFINRKREGGSVFG